MAAFRTWRRRRPFVGGLLTILAGVEMFFSGQLDLGNIHVQVGFEGFQATLIPILMVLLGALAILSPAQRIFYGIFALALAVYSLVGVNLGGFFLGMLLGAAGGVLVVAWRPKSAVEAVGSGQTGVESAVDGAGTAADDGTPEVDDAAEPRPFARSRS